MLTQCTGGLQCFQKMNRWKKVSNKWNIAKNIHEMNKWITHNVVTTKRNYSQLSIIYGRIIRFSGELWQVIKRYKTQYNEINLKNTRVKIIKHQNIVAMT